MTTPVNPKKPSITLLNGKKRARPSVANVTKVGKIYQRFHNELQQQSSFRPKRHRINKK